MVIRQSRGRYQPVFFSHQLASLPFSYSLPGHQWPPLAFSQLIFWLPTNLFLAVSYLLSGYISYPPLAISYSLPAEIS
jgi:hypothetical protein